MNISAYGIERLAANTFQKLLEGYKLEEGALWSG